jgi:hypothetical protein
MQPSGSERRTGRRVNIQAALVLRRIDGQKASQAVECTTRDVSLAGAYFETDQPDGFQPDEVVMASIAIPENDRRTFPFARLAGRSRIVRVQELPQSRGAKRFGVAIQFTRDATALTSIPTVG